MSLNSKQWTKRGVQQVHSKQ